MVTPVSFKSRFCPSPTGLMHLGNLRTALFNVLFALSQKKHFPDASFLLRIEDTDLARSGTDFADFLIRDLKWLDLHWQEGPGCGGPHEPYFQAQRVGIYQKFYQQLLQNHQAYWCYCTDTELTIARKNQLNAGLPPRYPGTCRHLTPEQQAVKKAKGLVPALRFRIPDDETISFDDFIQGPKNFATNDIGDFIIQKADLSASFMFCNAVDDALMQVTHVMRGEDHLTNTPRQLLVLKALGLKVPQYGHMPLILGFDGKPLSKRNGSQSAESLRDQGYFPLAVNNYLSRLGHHFENEALLSLAELGQHFSVTHIGRAPARFDLAQLKHWQKEAILKKSDEALWEWLKPFVTEWITEDKYQLFIQVIRQNVVLPEDAQFWAKRLLSPEYIPEEETLLKIKESGKDFLQTLKQAIMQHGDNYAAVIDQVKKETAKSGKALFLPVRLVITGKGDGPE
ncbi:MAG: glutamate--tRNA ligase, partial [Candidatus Berkiellales bacterium]